MAHDSRRRHRHIDETYAARAKLTAGATCASNDGGNNAAHQAGGASPSTLGLVRNAAASSAAANDDAQRHPFGLIIAEADRRRKFNALRELEIHGIASARENSAAASRLARRRRRREQRNARQIGRRRLADTIAKLRRLDRLDRLVGGLIIGSRDRLVWQQRRRSYVRNGAYYGGRGALSIA